MASTALWFLKKYCLRTNLMAFLRQQCPLYTCDLANTSLNLQGNFLLFIFSNPWNILWNLIYIRQCADAMNKDDQLRLCTHLCKVLEVP